MTIKESGSLAVIQPQELEQIVTWVETISLIRDGTLPFSPGYRGLGHSRGCPDGTQLVTHDTGNPL